MRKTKRIIAGYTLAIFVLLGVVYMISNLAAFTFTGSKLSNMYKEIGIAGKVVRIIDLKEIPELHPIEIYILIPRSSYSRESIIKIIKWYSSNQGNKWIYVKIFTNPELAEQAQPLPLERGLVLPKASWAKFKERLNEPHDAAFALNYPFDSEQSGFLEYRPVLWLPFYWRKIDFNSLSDLR